MLVSWNRECFSISPSHHNIWAFWCQNSKVKLHKRLAFFFDVMIDIKSFVSYFGNTSLSQSHDSLWKFRLKSRKKNNQCSKNDFKKYLG